MSEYLSVARRMWHLLEPLHATLHFAPEARQAAADLGHDVSSRRPGYFAWRTAPLGAAGPELAAATYYTFSPRMIARYLPRIWTVAAPAKVLDARHRLAARGWIAPDGTATERARKEREAIERTTDRLAAGPWRALGHSRAERPAQLHTPVLGAVFEAGYLPRHSTLGIGTVTVGHP
ncbi:helix-turn-helix domain-containing protein [Streptomyces sp. NPDC054765]